MEKISVLFHPSFVDPYHKLLAAFGRMRNDRWSLILCPDCTCHVWLSGSKLELAGKIARVSFGLKPLWIAPTASWMFCIALVALVSCNSNGLQVRWRRRSEAMRSSMILEHVLRWPRVRHPFDCSPCCTEWWPANSRIRDHRCTCGPIWTKDSEIFALRSVFVSTFRWDFWHCPPIYRRRAADSYAENISLRSKWTNHTTNSRAVSIDRLWSVGRPDTVL